MSSQPAYPALDLAFSPTNHNMRVAPMTAIAAMILGAIAAPIPVEPFSAWDIEPPISEGRKQWMNLVGHNVSELQIDTATYAEDGKPILLTHAQMDAIIAADEDPDGSLDYEYDGKLATLNRDPTDRQHVEQIYRAMDAGLSRDEIYDLFHSKAGKPVKITDRKVASAIITHAATAPATARSDKSFEDSLPRITKAEAEDNHLELHGLNVSWYQSMAATHKKDGDGSALTETQEHAIVAADEDPSLLNYEENDYYYDSERHRVKQIFTAMNAGTPSPHMLPLHGGRVYLPPSPMMSPFARNPTTPSAGQLWRNCHIETY